jgi:hypothetical protein
VKVHFEAINVDNVHVQDIVTFQLTSKASCGLVVHIPTLPFSLIVILSIALNQIFEVYQ